MVYFQTSIGVILIAILSGHLTIGSSWLHLERDASIEWNYENQGSWPNQCLKGKKQSPIDLSEAKATLSSFKQFSLTGYEKAFNVSVMNNGHTFVFTLSGERPRITGGGLNGTYRLEELHFHWRSEHTMEHRRLPLEAHLVHYAEKYKNMTEALKHQDGIAVLGVLFDLSPDDDDDQFEKLVPIIPTLRSKVNQPTNITNFIFRQFLPRNLAGFYRYEGSLTTPYCNEVVVWTVFTSTIEISKRQVDIFQGMQTEDSKILDNNYRYLQPLNSRKLYLKKTRLLSDSFNGADTNTISTNLLFIVLLITSYFQMNVL